MPLVLFCHRATTVAFYYDLFYLPVTLQFYGRVPYYLGLLLSTCIV
jgi:hypothetical protein